MNIAPMLGPHVSAVSPLHSTAQAGPVDRRRSVEDIVVIKLKERGKKIFHTLDGLRGIAAIMVLTRHVPDKALAAFLPRSYLAVDLFFVLSGFVLAHSYLDRFRGGMGVFAFMRARLIRLYPLYIIGTLLSLPHFLGLHIGWAKLFGNLSFAISFLPTLPRLSPNTNIFPLNYPSWSLFFELAINFAFAWVASRLTAVFLGSIIAVGLALLIVTAVYYGDLNVGVEFYNFWGGWGRVVYSFFAGVAAYRLWMAGAFRWLKVSMPLASVILVATFAFGPRSSSVSYDLAIVIALFPVLVLASATTEPSAFLIPLWKALGRASYAIYVLQISLIMWVAHAVLAATHREFKSFGMAGTVLMIAFVIVGALLFDRYYDTPIRSKLTKMARAHAAN